MFKREKSGNGLSKKNGEYASNSINLIGATTTINGEVDTESDIRIDGKVNGDINSKAKVVLGESGRVEGNLYCQNADLTGQVQGNVYIKDLLYLKEKSKVDGDIHTKRLVVDKGAQFNGQCKMGEAVQPKEHAENINNGREQGKEQQNGAQSTNQQQSKSEKATSV